MEKPQFTCLMTCYEQEHYIYEALDSLFAQDYENIQLILVDDGSKVFHADQVKAYIDAHKGPNITDVIVEVNPQNMERVKTYNKALPWVTGKYVNIFDGDDIYHDAHVVSQFVKRFEELPDTVYVLCAQMLMCGETFDEKFSLFCDPVFMEYLNQLSAQEQYVESCISDYYPKGSVVYRTNFFDIMGPFDEDFMVIDDWTEVLRIHLAGHKILYTNFISCDHRYGGVSSTDTITPRKCRYYEELCLVMEKYIFPYIKTIPPQKRRLVDHYYSLYKKLVKNAKDELEYSDRGTAPQQSKKERSIISLAGQAVRITAVYTGKMAKLALLGMIYLLIFSHFIPFPTGAEVAFESVKLIDIIGLVAAYIYIFCKFLQYARKLIGKLLHI